MGIHLGRFKSDKDKDRWVDWLADEPVPPSVRQSMRARAVQGAGRVVPRRPIEQRPVPTQQPSSDKKPGISINISLPEFKLKKPQLRIPQQVLARKKPIAAGVIVIVVIGAGFTAFTALHGKNDQKGGDAPKVLSEAIQKADFAYSLPKGNSGNVDGEVKYNAQRKVVNYKDAIGGVEITISQQPLPDAFKQDTDARVKKLAEDFSANRAITTANPTAYIGTSEKGPQTVIFSKKDLLVFIQSVKKIDDKDWAEYITNLQ